MLALPVEQRHRPSDLDAIDSSLIRETVCDVSEPEIEMRQTFDDAVGLRLFFWERRKEPDHHGASDVNPDITADGGRLASLQMRRTTQSGHDRQ
jgi:hypothetical protein